MHSSTLTYGIIRTPPIDGPQATLSMTTIICGSIDGT